MAVNARRIRDETSKLAFLGGGVVGIAIAVLLWWLMPGGAPVEASQTARHDVPTLPKPSGHVQLAEDDKARMRTMLQQKLETAEDDFDRQVWVADLMNVIGDRTPDRNEVAHIASLVHRYAAQFGLSPELVLSVMAVESNFDRFAVSRAGARGLMQIMPFWKQDIGSAEDNLFDIETNIRYGCAILKIYLDRHDKTVRALAAYNGSLGKSKYPLRVFDQMRRFKAAAGDLRS